MLITANIFQPLITVFAHVINFYHQSLGVSWGWSIVLLTVSVRLLLVPLAVRQFHSMRKMQHLQPQMKAIQQKYKADKQRQQEEMMKFYRENEVNPVASCLPMVFQLPVFIGLFYTLKKNLRPDICLTTQAAQQAKYVTNQVVQHHVARSVATKAAKGMTFPCGPHAAGAHFLFISDITNTASGVTLVILVILYIGTQIASTLLMSTPAMDKNTRNMMLVMPLVFVVFILRFPAGLIVYWITTNTWTMVQQYTIKRLMGPMPAVAVADAGTAVVGSSGGSAGSRRATRTPSNGSGGASSDAGSGDAQGGGLGRLLRSRMPASPDGRGGNGSEKASERPPAGPPPRPPRQKRKRSGRRR